MGLGHTIAKYGTLNTEYYKLKEFKKTVKCGRVKFCPSPSPSPLKQIVRPSSERWLYSWRKGTTLISEDKMTPRRIQTNRFANFFPVNYT